MLRQRADALLSPLRLRHFRRLWLADMVSLLGDWAGRLALAVLVLERTGSPAWAAAVTAVSLAGFVGIGQVLATFADRHGRVRGHARGRLRPGRRSSPPCSSRCRSACCSLLAFLAGLATPPFEAARSAALPDLVPEERYGDALALAGISVQSSLVVGYALGGVLLTVVEPETALADQRASASSCRPSCSSGSATPRRPSRPACPPASGARSATAPRRSSATGWCAGPWASSPSPARSGTVGEALVVPYGVDVGMPEGTIGLLAAAVPVGTLLGTAAIASGARDHHRLLRNAAWCGAVTVGRRRAAVLARGQRCVRLRRLRRSPAGCSRCRSPPTP